MTYPPHPIPHPPHPTITVFTPTYNRAHLLSRLYESLKAQTCQDFEWIIVDDGSTDNTEEVVQSWLHPAIPPQSPLKGGSAEFCSFPIYYIRKVNGGKHRAINRGVKEARSELFFIVDSDDSLPNDSIEKIVFYWNQIRGDISFGGVAGYMAHHDGTVIGKGNDDDILDCSSLELRYKHHVTGDMAEVFRTDVLKEFPFLEIENERFCPEALVWNRIAQKYKLRVFHSIIYYRDYLPGGLTDKIVAIRMNSPIASVTHYKELNSYNVPIKQKIKAAINYWRFRACVPKGKRVPKLPWYWFWCRPLGYLMHLSDK